MPSRHFLVYTAYRHGQLHQFRKNLFRTRLSKKLWTRSHSTIAYNCIACSIRSFQSILEFKVLFPFAFVCLHPSHDLFKQTLKDNPAELELHKYKSITI